ncbi:CD209 antigen-like protein B isoform X2 [Hyla sarda]|uniref:CD209 antigen-like protein B isoform X2 n=1 Tax=Hyla sarda TaxID=327740 RepID=UPI0024C39D4B|nr:CD209 antigen-like protein B isoform X2 [Hyla sarda]
MQNVYEKAVNMACRLSDDEADDYENVDNRKMPALPERMKKEKKNTGKKDLQLKRPRTVPSFQPPPIGLDFSSVAVNAAFRDQTVEQTSEKKSKWDWKKMVLIFCLVLMFLFWILLASIMFSYYSRISYQLIELKTNGSQIQYLSKKERETWKEEFLKVNQTLVNEIAALKSDVQSIKKFLGLCMSCPAGWTLVDSSCYFFSTSHETWENSKTECSNMASSLLVLNSQKDLDAILPLIGNKRFWIGLRKYNRDTWLWVDGTIPKFTNWFRGEPNNVAQREHCTEMISGGWNDLDCSNKIDYICKTSC